MRILVAAIALLALSAAAPARVERVQWDDADGGATFFADGRVLWIHSSGYHGSNVWRVDPQTHVPKRVAMARVDDLIAGDGQLWAVSRDRLSYVDVRGYRLRAKQLPKGCGTTQQDRFVHSSRLWFRCDLDGHFAIFTPERATPVRRLKLDGDLVQAGGGLWLLDLYHVFRCIEGPCKGQRFPFGTTGAWDTQGSTGWMFSTTTQPRDGLIYLVQFGSHANTSFSVKLPRPLVLPALTVVGDELWVHEPLKSEIVRYSINDPEAPPRLLTLPGVSRSAMLLARIETAAGYAWISVKEGTNTFKLFRVAAPHDPQPLRGVRAALKRELERSPARFGVARSIGKPLHVSCRPAGLFLRARAFQCEVRYPNTHSEYLCAAMVRGRLVLDRSHKACRS
jgi:hypothetical protein